jgi:hypothetical protein
MSSGKAVNHHVLALCHSIINEFVSRGEKLKDALRSINTWIRVPTRNSKAEISKSGITFEVVFSIFSLSIDNMEDFKSFKMLEATCRLFISNEELGTGLWIDINAVRFAIILPIVLQTLVCWIRNVKPLEKLPSLLIKVWLILFSTVV